MIKLVIISNPRTAKGGWEDEKNGCVKCGTITSVYIGFKYLDGHRTELTKTFVIDERIERFCLGCIHNAIDEAHKTILKQCKKRV